jgi:hypothetical protein
MLPCSRSFDQAEPSRLTTVDLKGFNNSIVTSRGQVGRGTTLAELVECVTEEQKPRLWRAMCVLDLIRCGQGMYLSGSTSSPCVSRRDALMGNE